MKPPSHSTRFLTSPVLLLIAFASAGSGMAQGVATTDVVGLLSVPAAQVSDTIVSLPLHRADLYRGRVTAVSGDLVTLGDASFAEDSLNGRYYLLATSGSGEGRCLPVTDSSGATLRVDFGTEGSLGSLAPGVSVQVIPYWTLDTVFPNGQGVNASGNLLPVSRILLPDTTSAGVRLASSSSYFYYSGNGHGGEGWRKFGATASSKFDDQILAPGSSFVIRHEAGPGSLFENLGAVQNAASSVWTGTKAANLPQDHALGLSFAAPVSLAGSNLFETGSFAGSATLDQPVDELLVYDQSAPARNRTPAFVYYYYTGSQSGGPGWRLKGSPSTLRNSTLAFQPGVGCVLRKAASPSPLSLRWTVRPAYLEAP